ncbi:hypothetical protein [Streptomyces muensis]|uniref:Integral membrane protein n=1 Tax=Streptomyces muensis TaxID=1077944 RepID=A0A9X1PYK3_STRM4|nr:hypothetical protein [Streptomyces muensis]MCF1595877.1 hypothetical protein [Streptomyces muensis]
MAVTATVLLLAALTTIVAGTLHAGDHESAPGRLLVGYALAWALFAAAAWTVRRLPRRTATVLVLLGTAAVLLAGLATPPRTSNDAYRYACAVAVVPHQV